MILLVVIASVLIAAVTIYQYREQAKDYHLHRLDRKQEQIGLSIDYLLKETTYPVTTENLGMIFNKEIYQIANILKQPLNIYDLDGQLIISSRASFEQDSLSNCLDSWILNALEVSADKQVLEDQAVAGDRYRASYTYINDLKMKPIGILNLPYYEDDTFNNNELKEFLLRLGAVYVLMLMIAIMLALFISKYITRSLETISDMLGRTGLTRANERILIDDPSAEIGKLIAAYNGMIDQLEESAVKLARSEREQAWREMAKQVAHEIKNPLTPMRLSVQSFERKFDTKDPEIGVKVAEFSRTLIQQIDTMGSIASAFSNFADMPAQQNETLDITKIVKMALDIFTEDYIRYLCEDGPIIVKMDRTQLIRVVTNLVKNAIQAVPDVTDPKILVSVSTEGAYAKICVADNGVGIPEDFLTKIFEPKFTTKTSGMGLGLGMVRNIVETYKGKIDVVSQPGKGTVFTVRLPWIEGGKSTNLEPKK